MKRVFTGLMIFMSTIFTNSIAYASVDTNQALHGFQVTVARYSNVLIAFALSTSILVMIIHFVRLANSYDHPFMRRQVQRDIFITGITVALIGSIGLVGKIISATVLYAP